MGTRGGIEEWKGISEAFILSFSLSFSPLSISLSLPSPYRRLTGEGWSKTREHSEGPTKYLSSLIPFPFLSLTSLYTPGPIPPREGERGKGKEAREREVGIGIGIGKGWLLAWRALLGSRRRGPGRSYAFSLIIIMVFIRE